VAFTQFSRCATSSFSRGMIVPLFVGREKSVKALEEVMRDDKHIIVVTQKNAQDDDPAPDADLRHGTIATVLQLLKLPDGTVKVLVEGLGRATIDRYLQTVDYFEAEASVLPSPRKTRRPRSRRLPARPLPSSKAM
jgi:ATP-dependent Lon protease